MHGIIFAELKRFVDQGLGPEAWGRVLTHAGLENRTYMTFQENPDAEAAALVRAASSLTGKPADVLLESFGEFIVPDLLGMYGETITISEGTCMHLGAPECLISVRAGDPA